MFQYIMEHREYVILGAQGALQGTPEKILWMGHLNLAQGKNLEEEAT